MYAQREDGKEDVVQIGNHPHIKKRYISHLDSYGPAGWLKSYHTDMWRPTVYIYAKRCMEKNKEFVPLKAEEETLNFYENLFGEYKAEGDEE